MKNLKILIILLFLAILVPVPTSAAKPQLPNLKSTLKKVKKTSKTVESKVESNKKKKDESQEESKTENSSKKEEDLKTEDVKKDPAKVELKTEPIPKTVVKPTVKTSVDQPSCARNNLSTVERLTKKTTEFDSRLAMDFYNNDFKNQINSLSGDYARLTRGVSSCEEQNPSYDFSQDRILIDKSVSDFERFEKKFEEKTAFAKEKDKKRNRIYYTYNSFFMNFPQNLESDDEKLTREDIDFFLNSEPNEGHFYSQVVERGKVQILKFEAEVNKPEFKEKGFRYLDRAYADYDQDEGVEKVTKLKNDLQHVKDVFFNNNATIVELLTYATSLEAKMMKTKRAKLGSIVVSDFHMMNLNKILFTTNTSLDPKTATASDFTTIFKAGDKIKGIAYLDDIYVKIYNNNETPSIRMISSADQNYFNVEGFTANGRNLSYVEFYISKDAANYKSTKGQYCQIGLSMDFLGKLSPRNHTIKVELDGTAYHDAIVGEFSFDAGNEIGMARMSAERAKIQDKYLANVPLPVAKMKNSSYESQLLALFNSMDWKETFKKAIIYSSGWGYEKNYQGIVIGRTLAVYMVSTVDGKCMYQDFTVIQDKVGASYGKFEIHGTGGQVNVSCHKVP